MTNYFDENKDIAELVRLYEETLRGESFRYFDVFDYVDIAEYYLTTMQESKAENVISEALVQHPDAIELKYKQAEMYVLKGKTQKALNLIKELEQTSDDAEFHLLRGTIFTATGKYEEANSAFLMAIERDDENREELLFRIGLAFQHVFEFSLALQYHYKLYEESPNDLNNLFEVAYCYEQLERLDNSILFYNKYLDISPYSHKVWYNLGIIYNRLQRYEDAVEAYDYTLAIRPKHSKAYFNKGNALFYLGKYKEALTCYLKYLNYDDNHSLTNTYIAECYERLGEYESAVLHYNKALSIDPKLSDAWFGLGMVAKLQGNIYEAIQHMEKAAKTDGTFSECYIELGELYTLINEDTLAINAYRYAIIASPDALHNHIELAKFYHKKNNIQEAREVLEAVKKDFKEEAELFYYLSLFALLEDDLVEAKRYLKQAKSIDNGQFDELVNYCRRNEPLVSKGKIDDLLKLHE
ncbi:tetratricopeptide repeat protein [Balneicella halophila]|uniref:Tetratricopeptide repeat protein n=1 Tax=Balneicella halophila TaxID=1537566 RepID=A0A7L4UNX9_BALHA|nr:tetratricopeptide repeat protein [Balneicella halophila]PVX50038.1 tetratricopeptide repeat protein [Balneicella halophila]